MAVLVDKGTRLLVQGITGREGSFHTKLMIEYGTKVVAGVTPGKGGMEVHGVPVYDTVAEAVRKHPEINASIIFVPARFAPDAVYEALDNGIRTIVVITEHIPSHEELRFVRYGRSLGARMVGPNCPGVISPGKSKVGIMPANVFKEGSVGIVSRSGTLTYEIAAAITREGFGQSTAVGIGGDPVTGLDFIDMLELFRDDPETEAVVLIGEIGGDAEERAARYVKETKYPKPVVAYVAGRTAPPGKRMGHAGAIISMGTGYYADKVRALRAAGISVAETPFEVAEHLKNVIRK